VPLGLRVVPLSRREQAQGVMGAGEPVVAHDGRLQVRAGARLVACHQPHSCRL
jgi:hypothetical protein